MKNLIAFLLIALGSSFLMGNTEPLIAKKYVYAYSGLKLRTQPNMDGQVVKVIPYGEKVSVISSSEQETTIEWMTGKWVKVSHQGDEGYLFEGFISELPIPTYAFEMTQNDLDLTYPILAWAEHHFDEIKKSDTVQYETIDKITQYLEHGITVSRKDTPHDFKVTMTLPNTKIGDAYNLVKSMLLTKPERLTFENKSLFVDNIDGQIHRIKVQLDHPVEFRKQEDGSTKVIVTAYHVGCDIF